MNLKALSESLGLSPTTVSRALNGYPEVSKKTRERVIRAATELNYQPNRFAKSLATGKTGHIGLIYPVEHNIITPLFNEFLGGITQKLVEAGLDLSITPTTKENELNTYRNIVASGRVDGLIVSSPFCDDSRIKFLSDANFPFIVHGRTICADTQEKLPYSFLDVDNFGAFERATQLLANMGHQHITLMNGDEGMTFAYHRKQGYLHALEQQGRPYRPELCRSLHDMTEKAGYEATRELLSLPSQPTAFLVSSMILALGVKRALRDADKVLGKDIALITFDDGLPYIEASKFNPALTTVFSSIRQAGYEITQHLHDIVQSDNRQVIQKVMDVDLIVRGSTNALSQ